MQGFWYLLQFYFINFLHLKNMNLKDVKNRLKEELLDLSLCDLKEVPVREIATIKRATQLDLSNNLLTFLPSNFVDLKHIVKLDLSKNMLTEIPVNFGELRQLKHLDLYANQISRLPLSLSELKHLRWLDLKENPLTPAVASVAGPCSNLSECQACARNIVAYLSQVKLTIEEEKLRRLNKATINDAETDTDIVSTRKGGKRKKKKLLDKKQDSDTCKFNSSNERSQMDENKIIDSTLTGCKNQAHKEYIFKENPFRLFMSMVLWVSFFGLAFVLTIMILLSYSKQSELVTNYIGKDMGIRLKEFQKHCINIFYVFVQAINNIVDNLYYVYQSNFKTDANIPIKT